MHCCVLHISCIQCTVLDSVSCRPPRYFAISAMNVVGIDTYTPRTVVPATTCGLYAFVFVCALDSGTQGLRGGSLEINRIYNHFQKVFMKTAPILGAVNTKMVGMGPRGHMAGVISSKICMQVVSATSGGIW